MEIVKSNATRVSIPQGVEYLSISKNKHLVEILNFPNSLKEVKIGYNGEGLKTLPPLPEGLERLEIFGGEIEALPTLPKGLKVLICFDSPMKTPKLPEGLEFLRWEAMKEGLPNLPSTLTGLNCGYAGLDELPQLPKGLERLLCNNNNLKELPKLPESLQMLICNDNNLEDLPQLPNSCHRLDCGNNKLKTLGELPQALERVWAYNNKLMTLPQLPPKIVTADFRGNNLKTTMEAVVGMPQTLTTFYIEDGQVTTLPFGCVWRLELELLLKKLQ